MRNLSLAGLTVSVLLISCKGPQGPAGPDGAGYESLVDSRSLPEVMFTYPAPNSTGPYDPFNQLEIRFSKIMDAGSIRRAAGLSSAAGNIRADTGLIVQTGGDDFTITASDTLGNRPSSLWRIGQTYTFTISALAQDMSGNHLRTPYSMEFTPEPYLRVARITPKAGSVNVKVRSTVSFYFNSRIDSGILASMTIEPAQLGSWSRSADSSRVSFRPAPPGFDVDTRYACMVHTGAHDVYGNLLQNEFESTFRTQPFAVSGTSPANGITGVSQAQVIRVTAIVPIDTGTIRQAFAVNPPVSGRFNLINGSTRFVFTPVPSLLADTLYTVTISTALKSQTGKSLPKPYTFSFRTLEP